MRSRPTALHHLHVDVLVGDGLALPIYRDDVDDAVFADARDVFLGLSADVEQPLMHDQV